MRVPVRVLKVQPFIFKSTFIFLDAVSGEAVPGCCPLVGIRAILTLD